MEIYSRTQVLELLKEQRKICSKTVRLKKKSSKSLKKLCLEAKVPKLSIVESKFDGKKFIKSKLEQLNFGKTKLTPRELDILKFGCLGYSTRKSSQKLNVTIKSIENYRTRIFKKLKVKNMRHAVNKVLFLNK